MVDAAAQDEGEVAEESAAVSSIDNEGEAGACELGIRYPTLQFILAGKLTKQSIQVHITYDIITLYMISYMMSYMMGRCRAGKPMQGW